MPPPDAALLGNLLPDLLRAGIALLLVSTLLYLMRLQARLAVLRAGQGEMAGVLHACGQAVDGARGAVETLCAAATGTADRLGRAVDDATALSTEMDAINARGRELLMRLVEAEAAARSARTALASAQAAAAVAEAAKPDQAKPDPAGVEPKWTRRRPADPAPIPTEAAAPTQVDAPAQVDAAVPVVAAEASDDGPGRDDPAGSGADFAVLRWPRRRTGPMPEHAALDARPPIPHLQA